MYIKRLKISNVRCVAQAALEPHECLNFIIGDNASGKTSLLEAIYVLSRGQSFRSGSLGKSLRAGEKEFIVFAEIARQDREARRIGVKFDQSGIRLQMNAEPVKRLADIAACFPVQAIDPNVHRLLEEGPNHRRKFLDWGVFHVEQDFYTAWRRYMQVLRQRNAVLKTRPRKSDVVVWDSQLIESGERVNAFRQQYVKELAPRVREHAEDVLGPMELEVRYFTGWPTHSSFGETLIRNLSRDLELGYTQAGPHRADLKIRAGGRVARDLVSRGQQKVITVAMLLAQANLLVGRRGISPVILVDDLAAELGVEYRGRLIDKMQRMGGQFFLSFLSHNDIPTSIPESKAKMFHVEHGEIAEYGG